MLKRFVLGATLLMVLVVPAAAQSKSPLDWVPPRGPHNGRQVRPRISAIVRRLQPGLTGQELEKAQLQVAQDMAMLIALVGRDEAVSVERMWERRLAAMYDSPYGDKTLQCWGITPVGIEASGSSERPH